MTTLGEICSPKQWPILSQTKMSPTGYPVYGANGHIGYHSTSTHERPVILIGCRGSCGTVTLAPANIYASGNAMALDDLDEERVDQRFLAHYLKHRGFAEVTTGSSQPQITRQNIVRVPVPLPQLRQQRRIADILDHAHALRTQRLRSVELMLSLRASMLESILRQFDERAGWNRKQLLELVSSGDNINYGVVQPGGEFEGGVPLVRAGDIRGGDVLASNLKRIAPSIEGAYQRSRIKGNEILVSCVGSIGEVALASSDLAGANIARAVARVPIESEPLRVIIADQLSSPAIQQYFTRELRTVAQPTLNIKQLAETEVVVPPPSVLQYYYSWQLAQRQRAISIAAHATALDRLGSALQDHAFSGEL